jgi:hypothetical protein
MSKTHLVLPDPIAEHISQPVFASFSVVFHVRYPGLDRLHGLEVGFRRKGLHVSSEFLLDLILCLVQEAELVGVSVYV